MTVSIRALRRLWLGSSLARADTILGGRCVVLGKSQ